MQKKRIIILGAGISGLTAAFYLAKKNPSYECILLEKGKTAGGYLQTEPREGFFIERGPRIFKTSRNEAFLQLIDDVSFSSQVIPSSQETSARYLYKKGSLKKLSPSFLLPFIPSLLLECLKPSYEKEETIWEFGCRRFGQKITQELLEPFVLGIYGGDVKKLSVQACFPILKTWEQEHGSVLRGFLRSLQKKKASSSLFSFKQGAGSFISTLTKQIPFEILYEEEALSLQPKDSGFIVKTARQEFLADAVLIAVPAFVAGRLLSSFEGLQEPLCSIPYETLTTIHVELESGVLPKGFGYLIPSKEQEPILGVLFDSYLLHQERPCFTMMVRGSVTDEKALAQRVLHSHLHMNANVKEVSSKLFSQAIPQYTLGHTQKVSSIYESLPANVHLIGNYLEGISVNDSVNLAKKIAYSL